VLALAENRPKDAILLFEGERPRGKPDIRSTPARWGLARALLATGDHEAAIRELEKVVPRLTFAGDPVATFQAILLLAKEYERVGRLDDALALYRRITFQYRFAEPGMGLNEEAKAGIARVEARKARASAS
jgi:tetratricopeptide (TPR) repeat protein